MSTVFNNLLPVFTLIALGHILGRRHFISLEFFRGSDRLVYFIFFPVMLLAEIGSADVASSIHWGRTLAILGLLALTWLLGLAYARLTRMPARQVGAFSQCCYRFNTYIGLAVVLSALGREGVREFGILISLVIPTLNVLAVSTLIWYAQNRYSGREKIQLLFKAMLANPLILGCLAGLAYSLLGTPFPPFFANTFRLVSAAALPLALLSVGNALNLGALAGHFRPALVSCLFKLAWLPLLGYPILRWIGLPELSFQVAMIFLALPTSPAAFILSSQMDSDAELAAACIVASTFLSFLGLSVVLIISP